MGVGFPISDSGRLFRSYRCTYPVYPSPVRGNLTCMRLCPMHLKVFLALTGHLVGLVGGGWGLRQYCTVADPGEGMFQGGPDPRLPLLAQRKEFSQ